MGIGAFNSADNSRNRQSSNEAASRASLLDPDDAHARCVSDRVVERWIVTGQWVWTTQRHEDVFSVRRDIQNVRRRIVADWSNEAELVHD